MLFSEDIGVDLGTASVLVYVKRKGVVLYEPSVVATERRSGRVIAVGQEARRMLGRTPGNIVAMRPLKDGVIADFDMTEKMLQHFIQKACGKRFFLKPRVMVCIPTGVTNVEERAVRQAVMQAGAKNAHLIEEPLAAALGAGVNIAEASGSMIVDVGGGTTDVAVISLGAIVCSKSLRIGGDDFDEAITRYIRKEYNLMIGERMAEDLKVEVGTAYLSTRSAGDIYAVRGRDLVSGLPKTVEISSAESLKALREPLEQIVDTVREVLEKTPPELSGDIINRGIIMTGGGALLNGLDQLISDKTQLPVHVADDPVSCVALGTGKALSMLNVLESIRSKHNKS